MKTDFVPILAGHSSQTLGMFSLLCHWVHGEKEPLLDTFIRDASKLLLTLNYFNEFIHITITISTFIHWQITAKASESINAEK